MLFALLLSAAASDVDAVLARGEASWSAGDLSAAAADFAEATALEPSSDLAWRRLCGVQLAADLQAEAVESCRTAVRLKPSADNRTGLALALLGHPQDDEPGAAVDEAGQLVQGVLAEDPNYEPAWPALCHWATLQRDEAVLTRCVDHLRATSPKAPGTLYYTALLALDRGRVGEADKALQRARAQGLGDDLYEPFQRRLEAARAALLDAGVPVEPAEEPESGLTALLIAGALALLVVLAVAVGGSADAPPPEEPPA